MSRRRYSDTESLTPSHLIDAFDCGSEAQTSWLRRHALAAHMSGSSRVRVVRRLADDVVVGYYALATGSVIASDAPERVKKGVGRYPVPVILLTRLGVDLSEQRRGLGRGLVVDALRRVAAVSEEVGVRALLIHAENPQAAAFYRRLAEFEPSPTDPHHVFLLMKDLRRTLTD